MTGTTLAMIETSMARRGTGIKFMTRSHRVAKISLNILQAIQLGLWKPWVTRSTHEKDKVQMLVFLIAN